MTSSDLPRQVAMRLLSPLHKVAGIEHQHHLTQTFLHSYLTGKVSWFDALAFRCLFLTSFRIKIPIRATISDNLSRQQQATVKTPHLPLLCHVPTLLCCFVTHTALITGSCHPAPILSERDICGSLENSVGQTSGSIAADTPSLLFAPFALRLPAL